MIIHKTNSYLFSILLMLFALSPKVTAQTVSLFDGESLAGWHMDVPDLDDNPDGVKPFIVRDGLLVSLGTPGGHLITDKEYSDYRLVVEYRFAAKPGNCGVLVHASTPRALYKMFPKSLEVQMQHKHAGDFWCIVEDVTVPDMIKRRGPKDKWGIVEGKNRRIENLTDDSEKPLGEWNQMVIECRSDTIEVWLNGDRINYGYALTARKGQIAVQAEGSEVEFRKLELTHLKISGAREQNITLETTSGNIEGSLIIPDEDAPVPVAIIIAGSGPTDRDGNNKMMKNNSLKFLAEDLAENGIASVRYDKRGVAKSLSAAKKEIDLRFDHYVNDAKDWVRMLAKDQRFSEIIIIGHSEGSLIGMLASELDEVSKYISLAGAGQAIDKVLRKQLSIQPENIFNESCTIMDSLLLGKTVEKIPMYLGALFRPSVQPYLISWFKHNPQKILAQLHKPTLLVQGTTDIQVDLEEVEFLRKANSDAQVIVIDSMNHVFKIAPIDRQENMATYNNPEGKNHPELIKGLADFIKKKGEINLGGYHIWPISQSEEAHDGYPFWSPDGSKIIYSSGTRTSCRTIVYDLSSKQFDTLSISFAQHARWSPEGSEIVYDGDFGKQIEIYDTNQGKSKVLDTKGILISQSGMPCWSPGGREIAYSSNGRIFTQTIPDGQPKLIFEMSKKIATPFDWYEENKLVVDLRDAIDPANSDIWIIPIESGEPRALIQLPGRQVKPDVSPDGKHIVFASDHEGNADLWLQNMEGGELQRLTYYEGDILNPGYDVEPSWSPDGQSIAYSSTRGGKWGIWLMEINLK
jgi:dipeptidyl aminopeptidase/acylaminoacyl peptidase